MIFENQLQTDVYYPYYPTYYIRWLYEHNVDFRRGISAIINDTIDNSISTVSKDILEEMLKQYILYGAVCYSADYKTIFDLKDVLSYNTKENSVTFINKAKLLIDEKIRWFNKSKIEPFDYQDWYTVHKQISTNISISNLFMKRMENNGIKEGFLTLVGEVNKENAQLLETTINDKMQNENQQFVVLPFVAPPVGNTGNMREMEVQFIELPRSSEESVQNHYVFNKAEIAQGLGLLPERLMNLQASQRSGSYQSSANERLSLLLNIENENIISYQNILNSIVDTEEIKFRLNDFQSNTDMKYERIRNLYLDNVITRNDYLEYVNEEMQLDFKVSSTDSFNNGVNL